MLLGELHFGPKYEQSPSPLWGSYKWLNERKLLLKMADVQQVLNSLVSSNQGPSTGILNI